MAHHVYRHRKGGTYTVIGTVRGVVYYAAHEDGSIWWRDHHEFHDGRFQPVDGEPLSPDLIKGVLQG